jgi:hypothetical protein
MTSTILSLRNDSVTKEELDQKMSDLNTFFSEMHKHSNALTEKERERDSRRHKGKLPQFNIGDFVLVARDQHRQRNKLMAWWRGPCRITGFVSDWIYTVEDMVHGGEREVHVSHLKYYTDRELEITTELRNHIARQNEYFEIQELKDLRFNSETSQHEVLVGWRGFTSEDDTWEPVNPLRDDVPDLLQRFLLLKNDSDSSLLLQSLFPEGGMWHQSA